MNQGTLNLEAKALKVPKIVLGPIKYSIGRAFLELRPEQHLEILSEELVAISPKLKATCAKLSNGESIIVTERKKMDIPDGVDGVLHRTPTGQLSWIFHKELSSLELAAQEKGLAAIAEEIANSWRGQISYHRENDTVASPEDYGLRPPQLGALFSIGSQWSLNSRPGTVVMPTGTGKTETMIAVSIAHNIRRTMVAVPSKALRAQTADKYQTLGLLRLLNVVPKNCRNPIVGIIDKRPRSEEDLQIIKDCNVIVGVMSSLADGTAKDFLDDVAEQMDLLVVDEAHHVAARTWSNLKQAFQSKKVLQFTATPFRNDGKLVDGSVIYSYPLKAAQEDDYFKPIHFLPVHELDDDLADEIIAKAAIEILRSDLDQGRPHLMMARCKSVERAEKIHQIYHRLAPDLAPVLIHSELKQADERVERLRSGDAKIVTCVNMLGEGIDIPALKVAAIHDKHQSLAVLLQFVGRFTRTGDARLGDASVIANIANPKISSALEELYSQDSDWNELLSELSSEAAREHAEFIEFLENSTPFELPESDAPGVSEQSLRPTFSTLFYEAENFHPKRFHEGLSPKYEVIRVWLNENAKTLFFVTRARERVKWSNTKELQHIDWNLFVLHHDEASKLLYVASSSKDSNFESVAKACGATKQIEGEMMFRSLGNIGRLVFNNLGVTKHGRRNLSFAMYTGADVKQALSESEKQGSKKSNINGHGWENGSQITIGCSYKGRVWSKAAGTIPKFINWATSVGAKIVDETIDTKQIIDSVLIPEFAETLPDYEVLNIEFPVELLAQSEDRVSISDGSEDFELYLIDLEFDEIDRANRTITFSLRTEGREDPLASYLLKVRGEAGYEVERLSEHALTIKIGRQEGPLSTYFNDYPPLIRFVDLSEINGNILLKAENAGEVKIPIERLEPWDWTGVDINVESIWKDGAERQNSVQWRVAQEYIKGGFDVVFDDDGSGEAADLVCIKLEDDCIRLALVHCKFSGAETSGRRVKDVVEVSSQAVRSARWPGRFKHLVRHLENRDKKRSVPGRTIYLSGGLGKLMAANKAERFLPIRPEIVIVQPGVSKSSITDDQSVVLGAAAEYLKQTLGIDLAVVCSK